MKKFQWLSAARRVLTVALLALVCLAARGMAAQYQFAAKYTSGPPPSPYLYSFQGDAPAINNAGELAFLMTRSGNLQPPTQGLWRGNGGPLTLLSSEFVYPDTVTMNNQGEVAYVGQAGGVWGVYKNVSGAPVTIASELDYHDINDALIGGPVPAELDDAGRVLFNAIANGGPAQQMAYLGSGGPATPVAPSDVGQAINNLGLVAVSANTNTQVVGIPPVGPTTLLAGLPPGYLAIGFPQINNAGDVLASLYNGSGFDLYHFDQGAPTFLAHQVGLAYDINNAGGIAFAATLGGVSGIYTGTNPLTDRVIGIGDPLFGSTLTQISFGSDGLNDLGQVGFYYKLANGRSGVALATPVPEPATLTLASAAAVALCLTARRRKFLRR